MNNILTEKQYKAFIIERLRKNGYEVRDAKQFDRFHAVDRELVFRFLEETQPETMEALRKVFKSETEETLINSFNAEITKAKGSLIDFLKNGTEIAGYHLDFMYAKPATSLNKDLNRKYGQNIFSVMEEVYANDTQRVDLVIFLNGFAIISFELKCEFSGQSYEDAIEQYRKDRDPKSRLFLFKAGCLVNFAMDLNEVHMTTHLNGEETTFLPFNMGKGTGVNTGKGNPIYDDKYSVYYMWEDVLTKDTLLDLIGRYIFVEIKETENSVTFKKKVSETLIFPRFHQLDCVRKVLEDAAVNKSSQNYLIQHSTGSGKTNTIAWISHRLAKLQVEDRPVFDTVIVVTDRRVVDRQLQRAIMALEHKSGFIAIMDDDKHSSDLEAALKSNTKIIVTTIQKFLYIQEFARKLADKTFAVIIDEAHSSTSGKDLQALKNVLTSGDDIELEDVIAAEVRKSGKAPNISMLAFTATPKNTTLQLFGRPNSKGQMGAFHLYSMKQAVEEGFIVDVLQSFTPYETFYELNKAIEEDPNVQTAPAKRQIARFIKLHEINIGQRVEVIIEHFRTTVMPELDGQAKAMVVTSSREEAVRYRQAFEEYIVRKGYTDVKALVAFSDKVKVKNDKDDTETEFSEYGMNGFPEDKLPDYFDSDNYNVLIVANKYQTGFDQKKLCGMYVLKKLVGVNAVQTFERLDRICPPYNKKTFILDFVNSIEDIEKAYSKYYTTSLLAGNVTPREIYNIEAKIDGYAVIDPMDIEPAALLMSKKKRTAKELQQLRFYFDKCKKTLEGRPIERQLEFVKALKAFVRFYEFILLATSFEDPELHKKYKFIVGLNAYLDIKRPGDGFNLTGKITADHFEQKEGETVSGRPISDPVVKLPTADVFGVPPTQYKKLSQIIAECNSRRGTTFQDESVIPLIKRIRDIVMTNPNLRSSAKNNTESDFAFAYNDAIKEAMINEYDSNREFFKMIFADEDIRNQIFGVFEKDIYDELRNTKEG